MFSLRRLVGCVVFRKKWLVFPFLWLGAVGCQNSESINFLFQGGNIFPNAVVSWGDRYSLSETLIIKGDQEYSLEPVSFLKTKLRFMVSVQSTPRLRKMIFIIDISGSMKKVDQEANQSCQRLQAVENAIKQAKSQGPSQFAVLTFNSAVVENSAGFFNSLEEMFPTKKLSDVFCVARGSTSYEKPLMAAVELIKKQQYDASHELFFLSDGLPTRDVSGGELVATEIKDSNEMIIATLYLGAKQKDEEYLKTKVAGYDIQGNLLHKAVAQASGLVEALSVLSLDPLISGKLLYREMGQSEWVEIDMLPMTQKGLFSSTEIEFDSDSFPSGLEVKFDYHTGRGSIHSGFSRLRWFGH